MTEKKINVLQVNKLYPPATGGVERVICQLAEGLCGRTRTRVLVCQKKGRASREKIHRVPVVRAASLGMYFSMPVSLSFFRLFRQMAAKSDIVQMHMPFPLGDLALKRSGYQGKVVVWWHSDIVRQEKLMKFYRPLMEWTLNRADRIIVATKGHIDGSAYLKPYRDKCVIIPFGITPPDIAELPTEREPGPVRFLFVGRLVPYKGCSYLIEAVSRLADAQLTVVGDGPLKEELMKQALSSGIAGRVFFRPGLSDAQVREEFRRCDVFVLPSIERNEAFGLVQLEAMSWGKPVINTRLASGVPCVSLDGLTGLTVPPEDAAALADAMQKLADDEELRRTYGIAARKRVEEDFREDVMLDRTLALYKELCREEG